jgi:hypothetical protein
MSTSRFVTVCWIGVVCASLQAADLTVDGNLEVTGNSELQGSQVHLGTLSTGSLPILIWEGQDVSATTTRSILTGGRPLHEWQWQHPDGMSGVISSMHLSTSHVLTLFDSSGVAKIAFEPGGESILAGTLRVQGNTSLNLQSDSVLTVADGDARYLALSSGATYLTISQAATQYVRNDAVDGIPIGVRESPSSPSLSLGVNSYSAGHAISIGTLAGTIDGTPSTIGSGAASVSIGYATTGLGDNSIALGSWALTSGARSAALGYSAVALQDDATAIGSGTVATQVGQVAFGAYNIPSDPSGTPAATDDILVLGNGADDLNRSNALLVKRNGDMEVFGKLTTAQGATLDGDFTANEAAVFNDSFAVHGEMTVDRGEHNVVRAKANQTILVPEQGDISMGEFHAGAAPIAP